MLKGIFKKMSQSYFSPSFKTHIPREVLGFRFDPKTERNPVSRSRFNINEFRHQKRHQIRRHLHRRLVVVPDITGQTIAVQFIKYM